MTGLFGLRGAEGSRGGVAGPLSRRLDKIAMERRSITGSIPRSPGGHARSEYRERRARSGSGVCPSQRKTWWGNASREDAAVSLYLDARSHEIAQVDLHPGLPEAGGGLLAPNVVDEAKGLSTGPTTELNYWPTNTVCHLKLIATV
jgi:hypothetical protein